MKSPLPRFFACRAGLPGLILAALLAGGTVLPALETADGTKVKAPVVLKQVMPTHPIELLKKPTNGQALVECLVSETGAVQEVKTLSATAPEFGRAAEEALRQWEFQPGETAGHPASMRLQIPFEFRLSLEQIVEAALKRPVYEKITDLIIPAKELPAWPRPRQFLLPRYPDSLKGSGKYGKAVVSVVINKEGKVMNPTIVKSTYSEFILPAIVTAGRLEFPPQIMANGLHIYVSMDIQFDFKPETDSDRSLFKEKPKTAEKAKTP